MGDLFSYGNITVAVYDHGDVGTGAGVIGRIRAWGDIDGEIHAAVKIEELRAGGEILAVIDTPLAVYSIDEDETIETEFPYPSLPDSDIEEIAAEALAARQLVLA